MINQLTDLFPLIGISLISACLFAPFVIKFVRRFGLMDVPGTAPHKQHISPTPLAGGGVLLLAIALTYLIGPLVFSTQIVGILASSAIILVLGFIDDKFNLIPSYKIVGQLLASVILIQFGTAIHVTRVAWLDILLTLFWLIGLANAFNFVDSKDGLAVGIGGIASAFFMLVTIDSAQPQLAQLSAVLLGACIGIFFYNSPPAQMFLGDSGAQTIGFLLAAIAIAYVPAKAGLPQAVSWFVPILVLGVPIFDTVLVVQYRLRHGHPIYKPGLDHLYHRLVDLGIAETRAVVAMHVLTIMLGLIAFFALSLSVVGANLLFLIVVLAGISGIVFLERTNLPKDR